MPDRPREGLDSAKSCRPLIAGPSLGGAALYAAPPRPSANTGGSPTLSGFQALVKTVRPSGKA
eukprot:2825427-Alexandrium_andersonii.AAC.1